MLFPITCGIILIIIAGIFLNKTKKENKVEVNRDEQPVLIELTPKGTSNNPVKCIVGDTIFFKVLGYSDYKKQNLVELNGGNITWHADYYHKDVLEKDFGIENTYTTPSEKGYFEVYVKYMDSKLNTSSKCKILVEV